MDSIILNFKEIITSKYAQFKGRADRAEFWQYVLVFVIISIIFSLLMNICGGMGVVYYIVLGLYALVSLALLVPSLAVGVRRMHDIGKGGGWLFINLVPIIGGLWFLILAIKEGEKQTNRFN